MRLPRLFAALALGCTQPTPAPIRKPDCVVGAMAACLCEGDREGWQACGADRRLGACVCGDGGATITPPPMCVDPFARCGGRCANLLVDQEHCGRCASPCPEGQLCFNGSCALLADARAPTDAPTDAPAPDDASADAPAPDDASADAPALEDASADAPASDAAGDVDDVADGA